MEPKLSKAAVLRAKTVSNVSGFPSFALVIRSPVHPLISAVPAHLLPAQVKLLRELL
jgi:hypothetical protein